MNKLKKIVALTAAAALTVTCLVGCGKSKKSADGVTEVSAFIFMTPTAYSPDLPIWKAAEEKTGIRLNSVVSSINSDENSAYTTMLAGDKLPDIIRTNVVNIRELAGDGALVPLDDLIDKYAPNIKEFFEKCPEAKKLATLPDGHIYFIPGSLSGLDKDGAPSTGFFIRQDWLDKLGLKAPTTIQELHDVLYAFKNNDPNGNGLKDEIPYFNRDHMLDGLLQLWKVNTDCLLVDGEYIYSPITDNYKTAMKELAKWYSEGLIDTELYSRTSAREQLLGQNIGGVTCDWFSSTSKFNDSYKDAVPGLDFEPILPPKNIDGNVVSYIGRGKLHNWAWGLSADTDKSMYEDLIKYFDFWMSDEGSDLIAYGVEGVSYTKDADGKIEWSEAALSYADGVPNYLRSIGNCEIGTVGKIESEKSAMNAIGLKGFEAYEPIIAPVAGKISFTEEEQDIVNKYQTNVQTAVAEQQQKWLMGAEDVDATWDKYISALKGMGVDELVKVYKTAYDRMYK